LPSRYLELSADDRKQLTRLGEVLDGRFEQVLARLVQAYGDNTELTSLIPPTGLEAALRPGLREYIDTLEQDTVEAFLDKTARDTEQSAAQGAPYDALVVAIMGLEQVVAGVIREAFASEADAAAVRAPFLRFGHIYLARVAQAYLAGKVSTIKAQQDAMLALSTPVVEVWQGILALPLVGTIDTGRARQITQGLLRRIRDTQARIVILDITGVPLVDTKIANHLMKTIRAARLLGARGILVGISPEIADTLVSLDIGLEGIETYFSLRQGLEAAFAQLGAHVVSNAAVVA
jgi:rsbT co-antagonist protein RsbR